MTQQRWTPGTEILWRVGEDVVEAVRVVRDDSDGLVVWTPARADGREHDRVRVTPTNGWWSVDVLLGVRAEDAVRWHVAVQDPLTRDPDGVRTRDHLLGIDVAPDRTRRRTGEADLELAVRAGRYNRDEAELITTVAAQAEAVIDAWGSPFCDGWEAFRPDPDWPLPTLPVTPDR